VNIPPFLKALFYLNIKESKL